MLSRSERPPRYQGTTWWMWQSSNGTAAVRVDARSVHRPQCEPLRRSGDACGAADVERLATTVEHDRDDLGLAAQPPHGGDRECCGVVGLADRAAREAGTQRVVVDQDD